MKRSIGPLMGCILLPGLFYTAAALSADDAEWLVQDSLVGVGTGSPAVKLHVVDVAAAAQVRVENLGQNTGTQVMLSLVNDGGTRFDLTDNSTGANWVFQNQLGSFDVTLAGTGTREFRFYPNGNLELSGSLIQASSRTLKNQISAVDPQSVLARVLALPINSWSYIKEQGVTHIGPMAEDFYQSFGLGGTDKGISPVDTGGVALAAIQGLKQTTDNKLAEKDRHIAALESDLQQLRATQALQADRMLQLELALTEVMRNQSAEVQLGQAN